MIGFNYFSDIFRTRGNFCREGIQAVPGISTTARARSKETGESEPGQRFGREDLARDRGREKRMKKIERVGSDGRGDSTVEI